MDQKNIYCSITKQYVHLKDYNDIVKRNRKTQSDL